MDLERGTSLSTLCPGISARSMFIERSGTFSMIAMTNTSTPMPPSQWVRLRQNRSPRLMLSTSVRMKAAVVVKQLTVSKNASMYEGISPLMTKGRAPIAEMDIHERDTMARPSRMKISFSAPLQSRETAKPSAAAIRMVMMKASAQLSPYIRAAASGRSSSAASKRMTLPTV